MDYRHWHNVLTGVVLSVFVATEAGNILLIGSISIKKMKKINSITMDIIRCLIVCGLSASLFLLIPASVTACAERPLLSSKGCVYEGLFLQIFELANKMLMVFLGAERLMVSLYRRGIRMSNAQLKRSLAGVFIISVTISCLSLIKDEDYTEEDALTCMLPGNLFTVSFEIFLSLMLCIIVLAMTSCRSFVCNIVPIQDENNREQFSLSRPSIHLNTDVGVLPNIEIKTTLAIICLMLPVALLNLAGSIIKLIDLIYYHGDSFLTNISPLLHSLVYLGQPFLLYAVQSTVQTNLKECVEERRNAFTRTTSFQITHQPTDVDRMEQTSTQVKKPSMTIDVNVTSSDKEIVTNRVYKKNESKLSCISVGPFDSLDNGKCHQPEAKSSEEVSDSVFQNSKIMHRQSSLENTGSIENSEESVRVRTGSSKRFNESTPSPSLSNSNTTILFHEMKCKLNRSVSECYYGMPRFKFYSREENDIDPSEMASKNKNANKEILNACADDEKKGIKMKKMSLKLQADNESNITTSNMSEVEPVRIYGQSKSDRAASVDSQPTRSRRASGIFIEVETDEILTRVWKKESDTGELISSKIVTKGGASRDVIPQ